jgi:hypothetical protein
VPVAEVAPWSRRAARAAYGPEGDSAACAPPRTRGNDEDHRPLGRGKSAAARHRRRVWNPATGSSRPRLPIRATTTPSYGRRARRDQWSRLLEPRTKVPSPSASS